MSSDVKAPNLVDNKDVLAEHSKRKVSYYYDATIGNYYYGQGHVMKPNRIRMTHSLIYNYGLYKEMHIFRPLPASYEALVKFHSEEYIGFLKVATPETAKNYQKEMGKFNVGEDCPLFEGLYEFCQLSCGGSLAAADKINKRGTDIAINWMGGLHHAKKMEASGFCYTNDIVLAILELLNHHKRVLYVDIDVHHGDGVEEAFYHTNRVMTVSFHKYGDFFPGTGSVLDTGVDNGKMYSVNVPFRSGITDAVYQHVFEPVMKKVMERFDPGVVVLQCGADSLSGDRLGVFNMTIKGHGSCVTFFKRYNVPLMLLGGGGYTPKNVARCWTYETALALGKEIADDLPYNDFYEYFAPTYKLYWDKNSLPNENTELYLQRVTNAVMRHLGTVEHVPSVQMKPIPESRYKFLDDESLGKDLADPDKRLPSAVTDDMVAHAGEYFDGENENLGRNQHNAKQAATSSGSKS